MAIDVARVRADTPGCAHVAHFNNAGASLPPRQVLDAVVGHLKLEARIGGYEAQAEAHERIERTYEAVAALIGCSRGEVALVENATRAWDMAFYSLRFSPGDRILTSQCEYVSNAVALLQVAARTGATVEVVPDDSAGQLSVDALRDMLDERVELIAITYVPTHGGLVNPAADIGRVARAAGVPYLLDACQAAGQLPLDVTELGCDMLTATGRKFLRAPRGTGFLYVSEHLADRLEPPFLDLQSAEWVTGERYEIRAGARRFETWECAVAARIGLGVAVDYALELGLDAIQERIAGLAGRLRSQLSTLPGVHVHDRGVRRCGIVTFTLDGVGSSAVAAALHAQGVNVSVSRAEFARFDFEARRLPDIVRASAHYYNTDAEVDRLCEAVALLASAP
jgi:selenocysteine lyase/cysteine desulfurase